MLRRDFLKGLVAAAAATQMPGVDVAKAVEAATPAKVTPKSGGWQYIVQEFTANGRKYRGSLWLKGDPSGVTFDWDDHGLKIDCNGQTITMSRLCLQQAWEDETYIKTQGSTVTRYEDGEFRGTNLVCYSEDPARWRVVNGAVMAGDPFEAVS